MKLGPKFRVTDLENAVKRCPKCGLTKSLSEFTITLRRPGGGANSRCRQCCNAYQAEQRRKHPERTRRNEFRYQLADMCRRVGITVERYEQVLIEQGGVCKICHQPQRDARMRRLAIDHDHVTGEFRGLLCANCNKALGNFGESIAILEEAINYLRQSKPLFQVIEGTIVQ